MDYIQVLSLVTEIWTKIKASGASQGVIGNLVVKTYHLFVLFDKDYNRLSPEQKFYLSVMYIGLSANGDINSPLHVLAERVPEFNHYISATREVMANDSAPS